MGKANTLDKFKMHFENMPNYLDKLRPKTPRPESVKQRNRATNMVERKLSGMADRRRDHRGISRVSGPRRQFAS